MPANGSLPLAGLEQRSGYACTWRGCCKDGYICADATAALQHQQAFHNGHADDYCPCDYQTLFPDQPLPSSFTVADESPAVPASQVAPLSPALSAGHQRLLDASSM